ncbi:MAG: thiamine-phosphate kinase, partial [Alphaproteobacteria bacterium]|nr:thiamine-phosphate kinase [Alphaproteobacteria bacterium]
PGAPLVVTTDTLVAGVHFFPDDPPEAVARKALRVNLSDLAAKGAEPYVYFLNLSVPNAVGESWWEAFARGLAEDQSLYGIALAGGDTTSTPGALTIGITALGRTAKPWLRSMAKEGDALFVTGTLGDAALGLKLRRGEIRGVSMEAEAFLKRRYLLPEPRLGLRVLGDFVHAAIDISDGLVADLEHLCEASGLGAEIAFDDLPRSAAAQEILTTHVNLTSAIYAGGDDYEILFSAAAEDADKIFTLAKEMNLRVKRIGSMQKSRGMVLTDSHGMPLLISEKGFRHFHSLS